MGKLIQCSSRLAENPYYFRLTDTRVYSIEEVCYYIRHNIYMIQEEIFDRGFSNWLREELQMPVTADKLEKMIRDHNNIKDIVVTLCCSCDYYDEVQINELIRIMEETENLPVRSRQKIKADNELTCGHYEKAVEGYAAILNSDDMLQAEEDEYGKIYHNMGTAFARLGEFHKAAEAFLHAYEKNRQEESLKSYLFALHLSGKDDAWKEAAARLEVGEELLVRLEAEYAKLQENCSQSKGVRQVSRLREIAKTGNLKEYYDKIHRYILEWKNEYRKEISV